MHYITTMIFSYIYRFFRFFFVFLFSLFCQQHAHASCFHFHINFQLPPPKTPLDEDQKVEMRRGPDKITVSFYASVLPPSYITNRTHCSQSPQFFRTPQCHHTASIPFVFHTHHVTHHQYNTTILSNTTPV